MNFIERFKNLPSKTRNLVSFGVILGLTIALPLFIWSIINLNFNPNEQAYVNSASCKNLKIYTIGSNPVELTATQLSALKIGNRIQFCASGLTNVPVTLGLFNKAQIIINNINLPETSTGSRSTEGFCRTYTIQTTNITYNLTAKLYHTYLGWTTNNSSCNKSFTVGIVATASPTATATATASSTPGEPNSCGGTCGSNYNCKANLYCYKGYCRNPFCSDDTDCNCSVVTPTPTVKPIIKVLPTNKTSSPKATLNSTTKPTSSSTATSGALLRTSDDLKAPENKFWAKYAMYIFGLFILIVISTIYYAIKKGKSSNQDIPHIMPPTNI